MPLIAIEFDGGVKVPLSECVEYAKKNLESCTPEIVRGIVSFAQEDRKDTINVTSLLGCIRGAFLERTNDYSAKLESLFWAFRGQLGHILAEKYKLDNTIVEKRYYRTFESICITGKPDVIYPDLGIIRDFKTCKVVPKYEKAYQNHPPQLNAYRWILAKPDEETAIEINKFYITYMDMAREKVISLDPWDMEETEKYIVPKACLLNHALKTKEIPAVPDEYPNYWKCSNYCPEEIKAICSKIWRMGQKV